MQDQISIFFRDCFICLKSCLPFLACRLEAQLGLIKLPMSESLSGCEPEFSIFDTSGIGASLIYYFSKIKRFLRVWRHSMMRMWRAMFDIFREFIFSKLLYLEPTRPYFPYFQFLPDALVWKKNLLQIVYKFSLKARWIICSHFRHLHIKYLFMHVWKWKYTSNMTE